MNTIVVDLHISADEYLKRYRNPAANVHTVSLDGKKVQFPANILQRFVSHAGIHGRFKISFTPQGKFAAIDRLQP